MTSDSPQGEGWWQASDGKWYPPDSAPGSPSAPGSQSSLGDSNRSFISRLFNTSFTEFMTPSILRVLFWLGVVIAAIYSLVILFAGISAGGGGAVLGLIGAPLLFFIMVIITRVYIELAAVLFKIEENTRR